MSNIPFIRMQMCRHDFSAGRYSAMSAGSSSQAACYSTPRTAVDALIAVSALSGLREQRLPSDEDRVGPVLGRRWAMIATL